MFIGEYSHTLDAKGRLAVPAKWRSQLADGVVVTRGLDGCLFLYSKKEWEAFAAKIAALPLSQKHSRAFQRLLLAGASDSELDGQGRIIIPEYLRQFASLKHHVTVAGLGARAEVWDEDAWHSYRERIQSTSVDIAESLENLGI